MSQAMKTQVKKTGVKILCSKSWEDQNSMKAKIWGSKFYFFLVEPLVKILCFLKRGVKILYFFLVPWKRGVKTAEPTNQLHWRGAPPPRAFWLLDSRSGVWSSSIRDCMFDTMTHENTWRDGIQYFMTTNRNACATLQNQGRDYQNIEILCWMFSDEHKPPYFRTPHCFKHWSVPICWFLHLAVIYWNFGSRLKSWKSLDGQSEIVFVDNCSEPRWTEGKYSQSILFWNAKGAVRHRLLLVYNIFVHL